MSFFSLNAQIGKSIQCCALEADEDSSIDYTRTQVAFILNSNAASCSFPLNSIEREKSSWFFLSIWLSLVKPFIWLKYLMLQMSGLETIITRFLILLFHEINLKSHPITYSNGPFYQSHTSWFFSFKQNLSLSALFTLYHVLRFAVILGNFLRSDRILDVWISSRLPNPFQVVSDTD